MKDWLDGSRGDLRFQRRLDEAAMLWQKNGRPEGNLWRSPDLDLLRRFHERAGDDMIPLQLEFFQASERSETNQKRVRQLALGGLITGFLLVVGLASFAIYQLQQAQRQRVEQLATNAEVLLAGNQPVNAAINAIAATGLNQTAFVQFPDYHQFASVDGSLLDVIRFNREQNQMLHKSEVLSVAFSADGQRIVSGSDDKTVRIWDVSWEYLLSMACNQLRYHPNLNQPTTDVAREAKQTCEHYVWSK